MGLAIILHIAVFSGSLTLPDFFRNRPRLDEVITIDLVSLPEIKVTPPKAEEPKVQESIEKPEPPKEIEKAEVQIPEKPLEPVIQEAPAKPVSLKPIKRKKRKAKDLRLAEDKERERRIREKKLAQRKKAQERRKRELAKVRKQEKQARLAALEATRNLIRESGVAATTPTPRTAARSGGKQLSNIVLQQYLSALFDRIHRYWILPEMRQWDNNLETIVVLTITRDGTVTNVVVEKESQDPYFDQFVRKTIEDAAPMPKFSKLMKQKDIEVGLRFRPGELSL